MHIVFIHPYISSKNPLLSLTEPLGLICLATYLDTEFGDEIHVQILDLYAIGPEKPQKNGELYIFGNNNKEQIQDLLNACSPDLIGITCNFTEYAEDSFEIASISKTVFPEVPVMLGGAHATIEAESILHHHTYIDYIVRGEGEITCKELVQTIKDDQKDNLCKINGLCYREIDDSIVLNPERELIEDLNQLPILNRKFIDIEFYKTRHVKALPFTKNTPIATIVTSRGCPFNCIFCSTKNMWRRKWRPRSAKNVIREIEYLVNIYGAKEIVINDDQFVVNRKRVEKICNYLVERKLHISLSIPPGTSVWLMSEDLLKIMREAGFYRLCFPIESGNKKTLTFIRKPINLVQVKEKIKQAHSLGYWTQGNFILGFPYETREEIMQTIHYAYDCGLDYVIFYIAKPYAGAEMYDIFKKEGLLKTVIRGSQIRCSDYDTTTLKAKELQAIHAKAVKGFFIHKLFFYLKPRNFYIHLLPKFRSFDDFKYFLKMCVALTRAVVIPMIQGKRL